MRWVETGIHGEGVWVDADGKLAELSPVERKLDEALRYSDVEWSGKCPPAEAAAPAEPGVSAPENHVRTHALPTDSSARKRTPLCTGLLDYAPDALDLIAHATADEFPAEDAEGFDVEELVLDALRYRDRDGVPSWPNLRRLCLATLAILHREVTGNPAQRPACDGLASLLAAYPEAFAEVAQVSWHGNKKHNPGQPLHHAREKSTDHADCIVRHLVDNMIDPGGFEPGTNFRHSACAVWRALILTQVTLESAGCPRARGAK